MSGQTIRTSETRIEALTLQSSAYGVVIPLAYGVTRLTGNAIWYGGFKAIAKTSTTSGGGKGGGVKQQSTTYTYTASVLMGLCHGQITGITQVWRGKELHTGGVLPSQVSTITDTYTPPGSGAMVYAPPRVVSAVINVETPGVGGTTTLSQGRDYTLSGGVFTFFNDAYRGSLLSITYQYSISAIVHTALDKLGLSFISGAIGQPTWSGLAGYGSEYIGYSGLAAVGGADYNLGTGAQVENHSFEVVGPMAYHLGASVPDVDLSLVLRDVLSNSRYGAAFPPDRMDAWRDWSDYCVANGLLVSPAITTQTRAAELVDTAAKLTNTGPVWTNGRLRMVPYGDTTVTGNGRTFTPNTTPVYDLDDECWTAGASPLQCNTKAAADCHNHTRVQYRDRSNQYNPAIVEAKDQANIDAFGLRSADVFDAPWICDGAAARQVAQLLLQRSLYIVNTYSTALPWHYALLEPMDLVTLTDAGLGLSLAPARVLSIEEDADGELSLEFEEYPAGVSSAALYPSQVPGGYKPDYNAAPGPVATPFIFEAPGALTQNGLEVWVAVTGNSAVAWGGCNVYASLDGTRYKQIGVVYGGARYGSLSAGCGASGSINIALLAGQLISGSPTEAAALNTLCVIGGANPEFIAYDTATLTSALNYTLGGSTVRGAYGTAPVAHSSGDRFARIDAAIAKSDPIDLGYIGKTIYIKCTSFNIYGGGGESLAAVTAHAYTVTGAQVLGNAGASALNGIGLFANDNVLSQGEKPPVILEVTAIQGEQPGISTQATLYSITTEKTAYENAVTALNTYLATLTTPVLWSDLAGNTTIVGTTFRSTFAAVYAARQALFNKFTSTAKTLADNAQAAAAVADGKAVVADGKAVAAQGAANAATTALTNIASDSILSPSEKPSVKLDYDTLIAEQGGIQAQATAYSVSQAAYNAAVTALTSYLGGLSGWNTIPGGDVTIVGTTFRSTFGAVYAERQVLLNGIAAAARTLANNAQAAANTADGKAVTAQAAAATADGKAVAAQADATAALNQLTDIGSDSILSPVEKPVVVLNYNAIISEQSGIQGSATFYGVSQAAYNSAVSSLTSYLGGLTGWNTIPGSNVAIVGSTFRSTFQAVYDQRQALLNSIASTARSLATSAQTTANTALTNAGNAQADATAALTSLTNIASDSILSPSEKPSVVQDYAVITAEQAGIDAQAAAYSITTERTAYNNAVSALASYLGGLSGWNTVPGGDVAIVGSTFRGNFQNVYTTRQTLLTKIAQVAGTLATWASVTGTGRPADNATVGAAFGVNITGQAATSDIGSNAVSNLSSVYTPGSVSITPVNTPVSVASVGAQAADTANFFTVLAAGILSISGAGGSGAGSVQVRMRVVDSLASTLQDVIVFELSSPNTASVAGTYSVQTPPYSFQAASTSARTITTSVYYQLTGGFLGATVNFAGRTLIVQERKR